MGQKARGMTEVVSNRNYMLSTTSGHCIYFKKGVPKLCPNLILEQAIAVGILPTDEADLPGDPLDSILPEEATGSERVRQIRDVIEALMRRNGRGDFTASGIPNLRVISDTLGYKISERELGKVWHQIRVERAEDQILRQDNLIVDGPEKPEDDAELQAALDDAIVSVMDTGTVEDFTAAGVPLVRSMQNRLGWEVTEDERDVAWARYNDKPKKPAGQKKVAKKTTKKKAAKTE